MRGKLISNTSFIQLHHLIEMGVILKFLRETEHINEVRYE